MYVIRSEPDQTVRKELKTMLEELQNEIDAIKAGVAQYTVKNENRTELNT